jgi:tRNA N6-adenosine threonylcarbamoyltransferase
MNTQYILGIETSCDETAAAVYHQEKGLLSSELFSQTELHKASGGVIPEVASREQLEKIEPIISLALTKAQVTLDTIDVIAVTNRPGLPGSLLIGVCFAKAIAFALSKQLIGINHLEGHVFSPFLEHTIPFPHLCLTASGGHTSLYLVRDFGDFITLADTRDDAAGEAFDKIAKLMNLPYPGGPILETLAQEVDFVDTRKYPRSRHKTLDFSFSGLKTAVLYDLAKQDAYSLENKEFLKPQDHALIRHVAASLHVCIADIFVQKLELALELHPEAQAITFAGGVACNKYIAQRLHKFSESHGRPFFKPSAQFCTDNAAMIAFVGAYKAQNHEMSSLTLDIFSE